MDIDPLDLACHLGGDGNHERLHPGLGAVGGQPVRQQIPGEQEEDRGQQPEGGAAAGLTGEAVSVMGVCLLCHGEWAASSRGAQSARVRS